MNLIIDNYKGLILMIVEGTIEEAGLKQITNELQKMPSNEDKYLLLDCTGIRKSILKNIGVSGFVSYLLLLRKFNTQLTLIGCSQQMYTLLKLLKLENIFTFSPTMEEAHLNLTKIKKPGALSETSS
ncbi:STAS domain-containing protein [Pontibacter sp. 13R65]|uniref:STAS domain-containing protein n=1 Tax=Pontibacter sp. 13R65 TaxID=3127458 RepID=UPI00301D389C